MNPYLDCKHAPYIMLPVDVDGCGSADSASVYNAIDKVNTQLDQACWSIVD